MRALLIPMIVILVFIGCDKAEGGGTTTPSNIKHKTITPESKEVSNTAGNYEDYIIPVEINLDDLPFEDAFEIQHRAKGEGHTFWWNGEEYTTDLYVSVGSYKWVRNSDDTDDTCYSNEYDECGICDGSGKITWYIDLDGDGLGDPTNYTEACIYPSVDEE